MKQLRRGDFDHLSLSDLKKYLCRGIQQMPWTEMSQSDFLIYVVPNELLNNEQLLESSISIMRSVVENPGTKRSKRVVCFNQLLGATSTWKLVDTQTLVNSLREYLIFIVYGSFFSLFWKMNKKTQKLVTPSWESTSVCVSTSFKELLKGHFWHLFFLSDEKWLKRRKKSENPLKVFRTALGAPSTRKQVKNTTYWLNRMQTYSYK